MFAQAHWSPIVAPNYDGDYMAINASIFIDGVEQFDDNLEIAVFVDLGNGEIGDCRAVRYPARVLPNGVYYYSLTVKGEEGELYTYRLFDHGTDQELEYDVVYTEEFPQLNYQHGESLGGLRNPWHACFATPATSGYTLNITPYTSDKDNYYLIASPVGTVNATAVTNLLENAYDLYAFNQSEDLEWRNYKAGAFTQLEQGKGYLYANSGNGENLYPITFNGDAFNGEYLEVDLDYDQNAGDFPGWNLVGNPYAVEAYILCHDYYVMNADGYEAIAETTGTPLAPMTGAFVIADPDVEDDYVIFTNSLTSGASCEGMGEGKVVLNLSNGRNVIDRAVVRFGEGRTLPKLQLRENSTKVYFTVDDKDYAIVRSANQGEMPVNFKAEHNGTYTFTVDAEASDFNYLHLIDNRNGADVDLLASPSYTFDALTTDYASRFRLVFATGNNDDTFAFASNGSFVISNEGPATVQVIDLNGRIMSSENINGSACINFSAAAGVYMIRLINGDNVKVQKVVVK